MAVTTNRKYKKVEESETGSGAVSYATTSAISQTGPCLKSFIIHLNQAGGSGTATLTHNSHLGAAYDTVLSSQDMTLVTDFVFIPDEDGGHQMYPGDTITFTWANAGGATYGYAALYWIK